MEDKFQNCRWTRWAQKKISANAKLPAPSNPVDVYLFDGAVLKEHQEFASLGIRFLERSNLSAEISAHATGVASLVAGSRLGLCDNVRLISVPVQTDSLVSIKQFAAAVDWSIEFAKSGKNPKLALLPWVSSEPRLQIFIEKLLANDFVVVSAAGNQKENCEGLYPCRVAGVIVAGGTATYSAPFWEMASGSGFGVAVTIMAPAKYLTAASIEKSNAYEIRHGTSFSAALVAGVISQYLGSHEVGTSVSAAAVKNFLTEGALKDELVMPSKLETYWPNRVLQSPYIINGSDIAMSWEQKTEVFRIM